MNIRKLNTDTTATETGRWVEYDDGHFLMRSSKSRAFNAYIAKASRDASKSERKDPAWIYDTTTKALRDVVLIDWKGVMDGDKEFPCTPENKALLIAQPEFREWLSEAASELDNFKKEAEAEDAADLKSGSPLES